jgi:DNA invertase Pin-like site-specific DNA recombinase
MKGQNIGYIRVSTPGQNTDRQDSELSSYDLDEVFIDYASGKDINRPQLEAALKHLRKDDTFIIHSMDRLGRNIDDLRKIVKALTDKGVSVMFHKESLIFNGNDSPMSSLLLSLLGAFAEFERSLILERQREGIKQAKLKGKYKGRKAVLSKEQVIQLKNRDNENYGKKRTALAKEFSISRQSLYNYLSG